MTNILQDYSSDPGIQILVSSKSIDLHSFSTSGDFHFVHLLPIDGSDFLK